jgi:hypothetical protein
VGRGLAGRGLAERLRGGGGNGLPSPRPGLSSPRADDETAELIGVVGEERHMGDEYCVSGTLPNSSTYLEQLLATLADPDSVKQQHALIPLAL